MTMKMTSTRADLGDGEGIAIRHYLLSSRTSRYFSPHMQIKSTQENSHFFLSSIFSEVILDSTQSKNVFTSLYMKRSFEGRWFCIPQLNNYLKHLTFAEKDKR